MSKPMEKPFEYLRRKDGCDYASETIKKWYKARAFVIDRLKKIAFKPDEDKHLHVIVDGDSKLMLSVARQVALSAHFINYDEGDEGEENRNCTEITIVSRRVESDIVNDLKDEECLCNLLDHCKYRLYDAETKNKDSFIDIAISIVSDCPKIDKGNANEILIKEDEVISFCNSKSEDDIYCIDTSKTQYADRMYNIGTLIDSLPAENIHDASRYSLALDVFQFVKLEKPLGVLMDTSLHDADQISVKNRLSNIFCTDCFESRASAIELCRESKRQSEAELWAKNNEALSKSEHARWVVEKLIMGFRPFSREERLKDERLSSNKEKRMEFRKKQKQNASDPSHVDLCSYNMLRRVNPDDMKYDSFLMLAIPKILEKVSNDTE